MNHSLDLPWKSRSFECPIETKIKIEKGPCLEVTLLAGDRKSFSLEIKQPGQSAGVSPSL